MNKTILTALVILSFSLAACTRDSSKTTENKNTTDSPDKKQEQTSNNTNTNSTDKKSPQTGQTTNPQGSGSNSNGDVWKFTQKSFTKSYKGCDVTREDCANIQIYYLEMTEGKWKKQIDESIRDNALLAYNVEDTHYSDFDKITERFMKDYEDFKKEVPDFPGAWYLKDSTAIVYNTADFLCVKNDMENYLGGAHGAYNTTYTNFDMKTGNVLYIKDIFKKGSDSKLSKMIEAAIRKQYEVKANEKLTDAGFFENKIYPNENFAITKDGIDFLFNHYEIAAYALGVIEVKFTYSELDGLLNKNMINR